MPSKGHLVIPYTDPNQAECVRSSHSSRVPTNYVRVSARLFFVAPRVHGLPLLSLQPSPLPQCKRRYSDNPADTVTRVIVPWRLLELLKLYSPSHFSQSALVPCPATTSGVSVTDQPTPRALVTTTADAAFSLPPPHRRS
jgi:hypothetical protein